MTRKEKLEGLEKVLLSAHQLSLYLKEEAVAYQSFPDYFSLKDIANAIKQCRENVVKLQNQPSNWVV